MDIFKKLKELNFPKGEYVVAGGSMAAHGIRPAKDLDILVTPKLYKQLYEAGWEQCLCKICLSHGRLMLKNKDVDIVPDYTYGNYTGNVKSLIKNADIIRGFPFMKLTEMMKLKREIGREKDFADDKLVKEYLKKQKAKSKK